MMHPGPEHDADSVLHSLNSMEKLMLYAAGSDSQELMSEARMQKVLFLVSEALPGAFGGEIRFEAHEKGPYSQTVDDYLNTLQDAGLMDLPSCALTDAGRATSQSASSPASPSRGSWTA